MHRLDAHDGLPGNPILVALSGRYDLIRSRFEQGNINYNIIRSDLLDRPTLVDLANVEVSYRFVTVPTRSPASLRGDRSTCMRVNSINSSILTIQYDDFFGKGTRRKQVFLYSISALNCNVINLRPAWLKNCIESTFAGNATGCHKYIFDQFGTLLLSRQTQVCAESDFGAVGQPFLKCLGRPNKSFEYITDLLVLQSFWAGSSYHVEVQNDKCWAEPVVRDER